MATSLWHYTHAGHQFPPVAWSDLVRLAERGELDAGDQVWNDQLQAWVPAGSIAGLIRAHAAALPGASSSPLSWLSLALGLALGLLEFLAVSCAVFVEVGMGGLETGSPICTLLNIVLIGGLGGTLIGALLGSIGVVKEHRRWIAFAGMVLNLACFLTVVGLVLLGQMAD